MTKVQWFHLQRDSSVTSHSRSNGAERAVLMPMKAKRWLLLTDVSVSIDVGEQGQFQNETLEIRVGREEKVML